MFPGETVLSQMEYGMKVSDHVSEFKVMESNGSFYIGTLFTYCGNKECPDCKGELPKGFQEPNSRETDYFDKREQAEKALVEYKRLGVLEKARY